ncbi:MULTISPECIES: TIGR04222 domain-containing membrane protein [unclassified Xanthomonas]|uniref:TIGR04222 domain-containing membrane protein n=1 Tax=unclassified Xanthomonas TaxID=2643310 RepID=UPI002B2307A6|nr:MULTISPECIES: TIGR04222 domain-containing membrane protein [unclassified Xanthomonas]MEA9563363.1 TIGR04222 domain-containing membrane protein [Xanthomonas sp. WHRI 8932A]MEA9634492.1 TIGR04222 domain-containing membrane protein [Xanthomonas sp. WHRI 8812E]
MSNAHASGQPEPMQATAAQLALWQRLQAYRFGSGADALPAFVRRVAKQAHCSVAQAQLAVDEYRRFCFLACSDTHDVTPSPLVDQVWHTHLTDTREYWQQFCPQVLQTTLHHQPGRGDSDDAARFQTQYRQTLERYSTHFGTPPTQVWPAPPPQSAATPAQQHDAEASLRALRGEPMRARRGAGLGTLLVWAVATLVIGVVAGNGEAASPLHWRGSSFLALFVAGIGLAWSASAWLRRQLRSIGRASPVHAVDTMELACLSGGAGRVADLLFARLLACDAVHLQRDEDAQARKWVHCDPTVAVPAALQPALQCVRDGEDPVLAWQTLRTLAAPVQQRLIDKGLLLDRRMALLVRGISAVPVAALWTLGACKLVIGLQGGYPVGYLLALMVLVSMVLLGFLLVPVRRSGAGDARLHERRSEVRPDAARTGNDPGEAVALYGTVALVGTPWVSYHTLRAPTSSNTDSSGSSCSGGGDSGGGDSGGDGGGGGGCGGCGGGGD